MPRNPAGVLKNALGPNPRDRQAVAPSTASATPSGSTVPRQQRYELVADLATSRMYVVIKATGRPVARYLMSPGTKGHPTLGDRFVIRTTHVDAPWFPPPSPWAKGLTPVPGGPNNPMGIFKMDLGGYFQYIHGTPRRERRQLGHPASHGCLRMSNENVLQLFQRYAGVGTEVKVNRNHLESLRLAVAFGQQHLKDHAITDGKELLQSAIHGRSPVPVDYRG